MKRRNFLSLIPALSAAPFLAKEIIQEKNEIVIVKPELVKASPFSQANSASLQEAFQSGNARIAVILDNEIVAEGWLTELNISADPINITSSDDHYRGFTEMMPGLISINVSGLITKSFKL